MIFRNNFFLSIFTLFLFISLKNIYSQDDLLYTCEYKSTEYTNHKVYGNESHFLNEYSKNLGWIKISNHDVKLSGIGWSQGMSFSSVDIFPNSIEIVFDNKFNDKVMRSSKIFINRLTGALREDFFLTENTKSEKHNIYNCLLKK